MQDEPGGVGEAGIAGAPKKGFLARLKKSWNKFRESLDRNALVAAILNATFWGLGYYYNGNRRAFGLMLMGFEILLLVWLYFNTTLVLWRTLWDPIIIVSTIVFIFALAYDAYMEAVEETKEAEFEELE